MRRLWPGASIHLPFLLCYWCLIMASLGQLRSDHVAAALAMVLVAFYNERSRQFLSSFVGFIFVAWLYDVSRFFRNFGVTEQSTLLCNLRHAELALFGINADGQRETLQDYFFLHHNTVADLFFALPYGLFLAVAILYAVYLFRVDTRACTRYAWAFGVLNILGFATYHVLPAAPPWYFHQFGCRVDLAAHPFEGEALARVDAFMAFPYFRGFYGRASEIFGAIPSLHVAYPMLIVFEGWRRHGSFGRALSVVYWLWMCVAAVYLDHHWVIDLIVGWVYAVSVLWAMRSLVPFRVASLEGGSAYLARSSNPEKAREKL
jgi:hypothetical protein